MASVVFRIPGDLFVKINRQLQAAKPSQIEEKKDCFF